VVEKDSEFRDYLGDGASSMVSRQLTSKRKDDHLDQMKKQLLVTKANYEKLLKGDKIKEDKKKTIKQMISGIDQ